MGDAEVLKYKDIVLRASDLDVLEGPCFLNDQVIGFYFSYLSSLCGEDDVAFVPPSVSFWLTNCDVDSRKDAVEPLKLPSKRLALFPVNDSDGGDDGTHWSILVYDRSKNSFLHLDSMQGMNHDHAFKLYDSVKDYVGKSPVPMQSTLKGGKPKNKKNNADRSATAKCETGAVEQMFEECEIPQQMNGYDCGVYVMAIAKAVCEFYLSTKSVEEGDCLSFIQRHVDTSVETTFRNDIMLLIEDLKKKKKKNL